MCVKSYLLHQFSFPCSSLLLINEWTSQWRWLWCNCTHLMSSCWTSHSQPVLCCPFLTIAWLINLPLMSNWSKQSPECLWPNLIFFLFFSFLSFPGFYSIFICHFLSIFINPTLPRKARRGVCHWAVWAALPRQVWEPGEQEEVAVMDNGAASTESGSCSFVRGLVWERRENMGKINAASG